MAKPKRLGFQVRLLARKNARRSRRDANRALRRLEELEAADQAQIDQEFEKYLELQRTQPREFVNSVMFDKQGLLNPNNIISPLYDMDRVREYYEDRSERFLGVCEPDPIPWKSREQKEREANERSKLAHQELVPQEPYNVIVISSIFLDEH